MALLIVDQLNNRKFYNPAIGFLLALRDINKAVTIAHICKLPSHTLAEIRSLVTKNAPDL